MVFATPEEFKWLALMSVASVAVSWALYAGWVWWVRGHLVHWDRMTGVCGKGCGGERRRGWERVQDEEDD